jgi:hypothetical protein
LRNMNVEFQQFPVNPRSAPQRIGLTHSSNKISYRWTNERTSELLTSTFPSPVESESLPVPSKNGLGLDYDEGLGPVTPNS